MKIMKMILSMAFVASAFIAQSTMAQDNGSYFSFDQDCTINGNCTSEGNEFNLEDVFNNDPYSYTNYLRNITACERTFEGCTQAQQLEIGIAKGQIMSSGQLSDILKMDREGRGYFIPLELTNPELLTLAAATSLGIVAFKNDQEITDVISSNQSQLANTVSDVGNFLGSNAVIGIAAGSYFLGVVYENDRLKKVGLFTVGASLASGLVTTGVKEIFGRVRPNQDRGPYNFFEAGNKSFYSGHTAQAFTIATVFAELYKEDYPIAPYIAYGVAAITAYARVHDKAHWGSDVIIGAVAGHLVTKLALSAMKKDQSRGGLMVYPSYDYTTGTGWLFFEYVPKSKPTPFKCASIENEQERIHACIEEAFMRSGKF